MLNSLFSLFYVTGECHRFLHRRLALVCLLRVMVVTYNVDVTMNGKQSTVLCKSNANDNRRISRFIVLAIYR